jgi:hypothetical protein
MSIEEEYIYQEEDALNQLSEEELRKFIESFDIYLSNPEDKARKFLIYDNLITFLDYMPKVKNSEYEGFKDLLLKVAGKIDIAKQYCAGQDTTLLDLLNESLDLINNYLKDYSPKSKEDKYQYPEYHYKKNPYTPTKAPKELVDRMIKNIINKIHDPRILTSDDWSNLAHEIALVHDNKIPISENDPFITKIMNESLRILQNRKTEVEKKKVELQELSKKKIELVDKKQMLSDYRKVMLGKFIDQLINSEKER